MRTHDVLCSQRQVCRLVSLCITLILSYRVSVADTCRRYVLLGDGSERSHDLCVLAPLNSVRAVLNCCDVAEVAYSLGGWALPHCRPVASISSRGGVCVDVDFILRPKPTGEYHELLG